MTFTLTFQSFKLKELQREKKTFQNVWTAYLQWSKLMNLYQWENVINMEILFHYIQANFLKDISMNFDSLVISVTIMVWIVTYDVLQLWVSCSFIPPPPHCLFTISNTVKSVWKLFTITSLHLLFVLGNTVKVIWKLLSVINSTKWRTPAYMCGSKVTTNKGVTALQCCHYHHTVFVLSGDSTMAIKCCFISVHIMTALILLDIFATFLRTNVPRGIPQYCSYYGILSFPFAYQNLLPDA